MNDMSDVDQSTEAKTTEEHRHTVRSISVVIIILVVLGFVALGLMQFVPATVDDDMGGEEKEDAELVTGFPEEFVLEFEVDEDGREVPKVDESYKKTYSDRNVELLVLRYMSDISLLDSKIGFGRILAEGGWIVSAAPSDELAIGETTSYKATKEGEAVEVGFHMTDEGLEVIVSYSYTI